jgi:3D (Asp-Asp-Asp) domain-containing protein
MDGIYTVRDTGGGVVGYHLDIFFGEDAYEEAIKFGRQRIEVNKI